MANDLFRLNLRDTSTQLIERSESASIEDVQTHLAGAINSLTNLCIVLERWPKLRSRGKTSSEMGTRTIDESYAVSVKLARENFCNLSKSFLRQVKILNALLPAMRNTNLPESFVRHIDSYLSPNLWLTALAELQHYRFGCCKSELNDLAKIHSKLTHLLERCKNVNSHDNGKYTIAIPNISDYHPGSIPKPVIFGQGLKSIDLDLLLNNFTSRTEDVELYKSIKIALEGK